MLALRLAILGYFCFTVRYYSKIQCDIDNTANIIHHGIKDSNQTTHDLCLFIINTRSTSIKTVLVLHCTKYVILPDFLMWKFFWSPVDTRLRFNVYKMMGRWNDIVCLLETQSFRRVTGGSPKTLKELYVSTKFLNQEIK